MSLRIQLTEYSMKKVLILALLTLSPLVSQATDVNVNLGGTRITSGGMTIQFGDRDKRGYYWDGKTWRDPVYWEKNHGRGKGVGQDCPPGQAKKGNCR
jgi:hypothetical protein